MRKGFSLLELIFVIVVIGILAKFGSNILASIINSYTVSSTTNRLQADTELTLKQLANRLQYRIKDSVIVGTSAAFDGLSSSTGNQQTIQWVGYDIDGWLGLPNGGFNAPTWSGFIDVDNPIAAAAPFSFLESRGSNTGLANGVIQAVSPGAGGTGFNDSAIFFTGANSDVQNDYGWNGIAQDDHNTTAAHKVQISAASPTRLADGTTGASSFINTDVYANYKLAWTAYALNLEDPDGDGQDDLVLYYDFQPWNGETFGANGTPVLLLQNVETFKFAGIGDTMKIQICVNDNDAIGAGDGGYSICKETAIF